MFFASSTLLRVYKEGLFLVVQWLRICLAMQRTWVQSFVRELRSRMPWNNQTYVLQLKSPRITTRESTVVVVDQSLSHVRLFVTPWTAAHQASLSFTISQYSNSLIISFNHLISFISSSVTLFSSCPQSFPASGSCPMSWLFISDSQSFGASALASVLPMNIQGWLPFGLTGLIYLLSKGLSRVFSNTTVQKHQFFGGAQLSL